MLVVRWPHVTLASDDSAWFTQFPRSEGCEPPWSPANEHDEHDITKSLDKKIFFFWQSSCPYEASWLGSFTWEIPGSTRLRETCFLLWPCCQQVRIVKCTTTNCMTRTHCSDNLKIANSVCCETNFRQHKDIYVFCPSTYWQENGKWERVDCKRFPKRCLKLVTISVPQCCECWSCRGAHHIHQLTDEKPVEHVKPAPAEKPGRDAKPINTRG
ncbi:uncharacterized protein LOC132736816 [Ruditapes philippinarum]|uniref:uncharacterized protein LOC132736816 n=1 Tax=Ruditapes philippinarum TaxID=129788 RepID=UPI00295BEA83|nr:uncharacterized protein LOC132736816 [Ruditapes philippinarum]